MKRLYHPGIPCDRKDIQKDINTVLSLNSYFEIVKCSEGVGIFADEWFWASDEEITRILKTANIRYFDNPTFERSG